MFNAPSASEVAYLANTFYAIGVACIGISLGLELSVYKRSIGIAIGIGFLLFAPPLLVLITGAVSEDCTLKVTKKSFDKS